jgi:hypothetical protein
MSRVKYDSDGIVRGFSYHDGFLDGILADDEEKVVHLSLRTVLGESYLVTLRHVVALHVQNFREGNVVLTLRVLSSDRAWREHGIRRVLKDQLFLDSKDLSSDSVIFILESSFGADILAVCQDVHVCQGKLGLLRSTK